MTHFFFSAITNFPLSLPQGVDQSIGNTGGRGPALDGRWKVRCIIVDFQAGHPVDRRHSSFAERVAPEHR